MNLNFRLKRLLRRRTCVLAPSAKLSSTARIVNASTSDDSIRIGPNCLIEGELLVFYQGGQIDIGTACYVGPGSRIWSCASISIGDRVLISHNVSVIDSRTHPLTPGLRHRQFMEMQSTSTPSRYDLGEMPVVIESDVWIAGGASILRGVRVGQGAVVAGGAMVLNDVPPYTIFGGNPGRVIRALRDGERE